MTDDKPTTQVHEQLEELSLPIPRPLPRLEEEIEKWSVDFEYRMQLRDRFALRCLPQVMENLCGMSMEDVEEVVDHAGFTEDVIPGRDIVARLAYLQADAMMRERLRKPEEVDE